MTARNVIRLNPLPTIQELLQLYNIRALKNLSQNFLLNMRINDRIASCAGKIKLGEVCEVGPGPGGLTRAIMMRSPFRIILIEKDKRFKPILEDLAKCSQCKFEVIYADILDFDLSTVFNSTFKTEWNEEAPDIHLIGNLPFNVATPLIIRWMKDISLRRNAWKYGRVRMTLTFQEEVACRIVSPVLSKHRCRLSVMCQTWCNVKHKFTIPHQSFLPEPKVNAGVVHFEPLIAPLISLDFDLVEKVVRTIFSTRQKYCIKGMQNLFPVEYRTDLSRELINAAEIDPYIRAFQITNEEWNRICLSYKKICDKDPRLYSYNYRGPRFIREQAWKEVVEENVVI